MKYNIIEYFEETVDKYPDKVALVDSNEEMLFKDFRQKALLIAELISNKKRTRNKPILIYLPKSSMTIVSFMGILYSRNFYTITDVKFPFNKVMGILKVVAPILIITDSKYAQVLKDNSIPIDMIINIDEIRYRADSINDKYIGLNKEIISIDPAYTFFTSGSTGIPKGVTITHNNIIHHMQWYISTFEIDNKTIIGNQGPFYFDLSTPDVYGCIFTGATLVIIPENLFAFPVKLLDYIENQKVNFIYWVPSVYTSIANLDLFNKKTVTHLNKILFNGEKMPTKTLNYWLKHLPNIKLAANLYGPTEATVACSCYIIDREFKDDELLPIGYPCADVQLLLFDESYNLITEPNIKGEIYIRGSYLSVGYWNDIEKTNEVFIQNPLHNNYPEKIYCTGDVAYYNEKNELMIIGRKDSQIKHMGYRIELGEIENIVLGIDALEQVCCLYNSSTKEICIFYVLKYEIEEIELRKLITKLLPKYMVPASYYRLDMIPLNANGKTDKVKLSELYF